MNRVMNLTEQDYQNLKEFCTYHQQLFGNPANINSFCGLGAVTILMKIYFYNVDKLKYGPAEMVKRMQKLVGDALFIQHGKSMDRPTQQMLYDHAITVMNTGRNKFLIQQIPATP